MFVVFGSTGNTGKVVTERLLAAGLRVRVVGRDPGKLAPWKARGAEVAPGALDDTDAVVRALEGAEGAYVLVPPNPASTAFIADARRMVDALGVAVKRSGVPHVVLLSSVGAQHEAGTGPIRVLHHAEQVLTATAKATTFVRAAYFAENYGGVVPVAVREGVLPTFGPVDLRFPTVATRDIGDTAARALLEGPRGRRVIELAGPVETSAADAARALERLLGKPIKPVQAPLDSVVPTFTSMGMSEDMAKLYLEMFTGMAAGKLVWTGEVTRGLTPLGDVLASMVPAR